LFAVIGYFAITFLFVVISGDNWLRFRMVVLCIVSAYYCQHFLSFAKTHFVIM